MENALLDTLDQSLYGTDTKRLCKQLTKDKICRVIQVNERRLPDLYKKTLQFHPHGYIFMCQSPMASGKTFQLRKLIKYYTKVARTNKKEFRALVITPRRTFASFIFNQLQGFSHYAHVKKPYSYIQYPRLIVQLQSLKHFKDIKSDTCSVRGYSLLILDEVHSIVQELFSDLFTAEENRYGIHLFIKVLRAIPRWLCFDAHLSVDLINILSHIVTNNYPDVPRICLINSFRSRDHSMIIYRKCLYNNTVINILKRQLMSSEEFNSYKPFLCAQRIRSMIVNIKSDKIDKLFQRIYIRDYLESSDEDDILVEMIHDLRQGNKICVTTSTKKQAFILKKLFRACGFKPMLLTGESSEEKKRMFAKSADSFLYGCSLFIYTTAFQVGIDVSSRVPYFDIHYIFLECSEFVASPSALVQAIGRIRKLKKNQYKICVIDNFKSQRKAAVTTDDTIPLKRELVLPIEGSDKQLFKQLIDIHFKEKFVSQNVRFFIHLFIRLMSHKVRPFVKVEDKMQPLDSVINVESFHYSFKKYETFIDKFIQSYKIEIKDYLDKYVQCIWDKLETETVFVSTIVNNFDAFIKLPNGMSRAECLMKICEFTNYPLGFVYSYIFSEVTNNYLLQCYFKQQVKLFYRRCEIEDLNQFKNLFDVLVKCCKMEKGQTKLLYKENDFKNMITTFGSDIVSVYSKFVSPIINRTVTPRKLFVAMMSKVLRVYIRKHRVDFTELHSYIKIIDIPKWVMYNASQTVSV